MNLDMESTCMDIDSLFQVGSAIGQHTLRREQQALVGKPGDDE